MEHSKDPLILSTLATPILPYFVSVSTRFIRLYDSIIEMIKELTHKWRFGLPLIAE